MMRILGNQRIENYESLIYTLKEVLRTPEIRRAVDDLARLSPAELEYRVQREMPRIHQLIKDIVEGLASNDGKITARGGEMET